jgi:MoaA/NifB/PqqE/SkfB family radical SAM enzyme
MGRGPTEKYYHDMNEFYVEGTLTCLKPEVIRQRANTDFPLVLNIEPTNDCNLRCYFCPRDKIAEKVGIHYINWDEYTSLIDECAEYAQKNGKLIMLNLHKDGEPLLHPKLPEMIRYAKEKDAFHTIHFNTNGMLLGTERAKEILKAGIDDITISVDAARSDTFTRFKGFDVLPKIEEHIRQFFKWRDELGAKTFIRVKIMEFEEITMKKFKNLLINGNLLLTRCR